MKKRRLAGLLILAVCASKVDADAGTPILFQGKDLVQLASVCTSGLDSVVSGIFECSPVMDEYAGEKIIKKKVNAGDKSTAKLLDSQYSSVGYDAITKDVLGIKLIMRYEAFKSVKEVLESKYGRPDFSDENSASWIGKGTLFLQRSNKKLSFEHDYYSRIDISTRAMLQAQENYRKRNENEEKKRKTQAVKDL